MRLQHLYNIMFIYLHVFDHTVSQALEPFGCIDRYTTNRTICLFYQRSIRDMFLSNLGFELCIHMYRTPKAKSNSLFEDKISNKDFVSYLNRFPFVSQLRLGSF